MSNKTALRVAFGLMLCAFCGCAPATRNLNDANRYALTVGFFDPVVKKIQRIEVTIYPDIPFSVHSQDEATNLYEVSGTLHDKGKGHFQLQPFKAEVKAPDGNSDANLGPRELVLGQDVGGGMMMGYGASIKLTRK